MRARAEAAEEEARRLAAMMRANGFGTPLTAAASEYKSQTPGVLDNILVGPYSNYAGGQKCYIFSSTYASSRY